MLTFIAVKGKNYESICIQYAWQTINAMLTKKSQITPKGK